MKSFKILVAIDKFKGSLTSLEAAGSVAKGLGRRLSERWPGVKCDFTIVPIADGGDGSASVLKYVMDGNGIEEVGLMATGPLGEKIRTSFLLYMEGNTKVAFIEMAKVSGLELLSAKERNPLKTTTFGLGELILEAYSRGAGKIILSIGGSATNDGGSGMVQALGFNFYNREERLIGDYMCGGLLEEISKIEVPQVESVGENSFLQALQSGRCKISVVCDVTNPLLGENGATMVYGPQKGATPAMLERLERGMENYAVCAIGERELTSIPGSGAAGGVGFAVRSLLKGEIISGWNFFATLTNLGERISQSDLVVSGEGRIDSQSFSGKVIDGVVTLAKSEGKEVLLYCGINSSDSSHQNGNYRVFSLLDIEPDKERCMKEAAHLLEELAYHSGDTL